jgi:hypothetical protein
MTSHEIARNERNALPTATESTSALCIDLISPSLAPCLLSHSLSCPSVSGPQVDLFQPEAIRALGRVQIAGP